jgi:pheromone shutdown protein TraB
MLPNTPEPQRDVIANYANELQQQKLEMNRLAVRKARNALFIAGALLFIGEMIPMMKDGQFDLTIFIIAIVISGIFVALGFWTKKKPYTAVMTGLLAFIAYIILVVVVNGMAEGSAGVVKGLLSGIIIKTILLINLILPLKQAKELQDAAKTNF